MTKSKSWRNRQRGAITLFLSLIMLLMITVMVTTAFTMSTTNLRSVGNMQWREQALAAANVAIDEQVATNFTQVLTAISTPVDLNDDGSADFTVALSVPVCVRAMTVSTDVVSSVTLPVTLSSAQSWNTVWEFIARVADQATGADVEVRAGVRVLMTHALKTAKCP